MTLKEAAPQTDDNKIKSKQCQAEIVMNKLDAFSLGDKENGDEISVGWPSESKDSPARLTSPSRKMKVNKIPLLTITNSSNDEDDETPMHTARSGNLSSRSTKSSSSSSPRSRIHLSKHSPGAVLRQSSTEAPVSRPLADLMELTAPEHTVHMEHLIHSMASLSRAGREQGQRKTNQDSVFAFKQYLKPQQALCGVLDGHGPHGHVVSAFVNKRLPALIASHMKQLGETCPVPVMSKAFVDTHTQLKSTATSGVNARLSGTTAVVCLLQGMRLVTSWVGDSRAMLVRKQPNNDSVRGIALTHDHKPTGALELNRILAAGGRVERLSDVYGEEVGPHRVWLPGSWVPGLAMSRSLGDLVAQSVGVSPEPDAHITEIKKEDEFLILASDGVWEFMSVQEAAEIVTGCESAEHACTELVAAAWATWEAAGEGVVDDISVVAVKFDHTV